jgi:hypothetical protein
MTSAWKEPSGRDDHSDSLGAEPGENQLDLFEILRPLTASGRNDAASPPAEAPLLDLGNLDLGNLEPPSLEVSGIAEPDAEPDNIEMIASPAVARDFPDVGVSDADDLRRLEESIRWLMNAGTMPLPRTTPLAPVLGLSPLHSHDADALLLDPETLFPPRARQRGSTLAAGAAKFLLVSAIAAPTAYFVASWMQFPGAAAPSDQTAVSGVVTPVALSGEPVAVEGLQEPALSAAAPQAGRGDEIPAPQPERPTLPQPASRAAEVIVVAAISTAPEPPSVAAAPPAEAVSPPMPVIMPAKPALRQEEIAMMVERGRVLFEAGDVAAARLFFRRAANAGDAAAAIAMGATYDPEVLTQRFIRGIEADAHEAQKWYEKAREMGRHIEMLAQRR